MNKELVKEIQIALKEKGYDPKGTDGVLGPNTEAAIVAFKIHEGLAARPYLGPITIAKLLGGEPEDLPPQAIQFPWVNEMSKHMGWEEVGNNEALRAWLKSDGATIGDPAQIPWCGDCMETSIRLSLPHEWDITDKRLRTNPYWAQNWQYFGVQSKPLYAALGVFRRNGGGHIALLMGIDRKLNRLRIRGGNQSNRVSDTWIDAGRMIATRKPATWDGALFPLPEMNSIGQIISVNEK